VQEYAAKPEEFGVVNVQQHHDKQQHPSAASVDERASVCVT